MYPIEALPAALAEQSLSRRHIIIAAGLVPETVGWLASHGWAATSLTTRYFEADGAMRGFGGTLYCPQWQRGERWEDHAWNAAAACLRDLSEREMRFAQEPDGAGPPLYAKLDAWPANPYLDQINELLLRHFPGQHYLELTEETTHVPLMAALVRKRTGIFSEGQKVYIHNVQWGRNETAMVLGRFRRKARWVCGHCPIDNLDDFRPKVVQHPKAVEALRLARPGPYAVAAGIFRRFLPFPVEPERP